jgi:ATP-binding cassette, subfamily C (CFTR/MRP), member 1
MVSVPFIGFRLRSQCVTVQHYALADQIIILGDSQIQLQGAPDDVLHSSRQILKTIINDKEMKTTTPLGELEVKQLAQRSSKDGAALNLTRKTGDLAVYGTEITWTPCLP